MSAACDVCGQVSDYPGLCCFYEKYIADEWDPDVRSRIMEQPMVTIPIDTAPPRPTNPSPQVIWDPTNSKLEIPARTQYLISSETSSILTTIDKMATDGLNPNILIKGSQGTGKSELAAQYAASRKRPLAVLEVGRLSDPSQIFGYLDLKDGGTRYVKGLFTEAITTPGAIVHLQEINRPENDKSLNALFSVLDDGQRSIWVDELQDYIKVAPGVVFFASMNEGFEFVGTLPLDLALESRFHFKLSLELLPTQWELTLLQAKGLDIGEATVLLSLIDKLRNNVQTPIYISTRDIVNIAKLIQYGLSAELAIKSVVGGNKDLMESIRLTAHIAGTSVSREVTHYDYI